MNKFDSKVSEGVLGRIKTAVTSYFLVALTVFLLISLVRNVYKIRRVEESIEKKEEEVKKAEREHQELEDKLERARSDEYVEKQLRDKLGLAKEGEIVVIMPPPEVIRKLAPKYEEEEETLPDPNWKKWLKLFL